MDSTTLMHWFVALGGLALVWKAAKDGIPHAVAAGFRWLLTHDAVKAAVVEHSADIKAIIDETAKEVDGVIDDAGASR